MPHYYPGYRYERVAHVRLAALPFPGADSDHKLDRILPKWDENTEWSLLLERKSFFVFFLFDDCATISSAVAARLGMDRG